MWLARFREVVLCRFFLNVLIILAGWDHHFAYIFFALLLERITVLQCKGLVMYSCATAIQQQWSLLLVIVAVWVSVVIRKSHCKQPQLGARQTSLA